MNGIESWINLLSKGGIVMLPILLCSVIALAIIIERLIYFRKIREKPDSILNALENVATSEQGSNSFEEIQSADGPVGKIVKTGMTHKNLSKWKLEEKLSLAGQRELNGMGKNIRGLEVIATISPLMGLFGTVLGMVQAFNKVAQHKGQVDPSILAGGIWEALLTTAAGLAVAIPAVVMLHYFERKIQKTGFLLEESAQLLVHAFDDNNHSNNGNGNFDKNLWEAGKVNA